MKIWVLVALSCSDCNSIGVRALEHSPSEEEINQLHEEVGGMYCINMKTFELEVNRDAVIEDQHD